MTIRDEKPENEMGDVRVAHVLTVAVMIWEHSKGTPGMAQLPCPICKTGRIAYSIDDRRSVAARCSTPGCVAFLS